MFSSISRRSLLAACLYAASHSALAHIPDPPSGSGSGNVNPPGYVCSYLAQTGYEASGQHTRDIGQSGQRQPQAHTYSLVYYVNAWFTVQIPKAEPGGPSLRKRNTYIMDGARRIAAKLNTPSAQCGAATPDQQDPYTVYTYHTDHLGSTSYLTNKCAELIEHTEYFPYGQTWVDQSTYDPANNPQGTERYQYTGKELDTESGLYYYGARYYEPDTGIWLSADPILSSYIDGNPNGGVFEPRNLMLYTYVSNNPLRYADPSGEFQVEAYKLQGGEVKYRFQFEEHPRARALWENSGGRLGRVVSGARKGEKAFASNTSAGFNDADLGSLWWKRPARRHELLSRDPSLKKFFEESDRLGARRGYEEGEWLTEQQAETAIEQLKIEFKRQLRREYREESGIPSSREEYRTEERIVGNKASVVPWSEILELAKERSPSGLIRDD